MEGKGGGVRADASLSLSGEVFPSLSPFVRVYFRRDTFGPAVSYWVDVLQAGSSRAAWQKISSHHRAANADRLFILTLIATSSNATAGASIQKAAALVQPHHLAGKQAVIWMLPCCLVRAWVLLSSLHLLPLSLRLMRAGPKHQQDRASWRETGRVTSNIT